MSEIRDADGLIGTASENGIAWDGLGPVPDEHAAGDDSAPTGQRSASGNRGARPAAFDLEINGNRNKLPIRPRTQNWPAS